MDPAELRRQIGHELEQAKVAREAGNEGRARVCARRAAGWAAGLYFQARSGREPGVNAYEQLRMLEQDVTLEPSLRVAAKRLTTRITPDHRLPFPEDPLEDARRIVEILEAEMERLANG